MTAAVAIGMLIDRSASVAFANWLMICLLSLCVAAVSAFVRSMRLVGLALLFSCVGLGGARHHQVWSIISPTNISHYATEDLEPIVLHGRIVSKPWITKPETDSPLVGWTQQTKTRFDLECLDIQEARNLRKVSGKIRVSVNGEMADIQPGNVVRLRGDIVLPSPPKNPGEFDYRDILRRQSIFAVMRCKSTHSVEQLLPTDGVHESQIILPDIAQPIRVAINQLLRQNLSSSSLPIAESLILGKRDGLDDSTREAFLLSGSMHLLAISGLHVGILLFGLFAVLKVAGVGFRMQMLVTIGLLLAFLCLTEIRPSVVRAVTTASLFAFGMLSSRPISLLVTLCGALLIIILVDPPALFEVGTHLSFHSVAAILFGMKLIQRIGPNSPTRYSDEQIGFLEFLWGMIMRYFRDGYFVTLAVFIGTAPLIMTAFQLIAPVGYVLGVFMIPILAAALFLGYAALLISGLIPMLGWPLFQLFDWLLQLLLSFVDFAAEIPGGHWRTTALSWEGCWIYYGLLYALAGSLYLSGPNVFRFTLRTTCLLMMGFAVATTIYFRQTAGEFRTTFISVGHGLAVLMECPNGKTILYDAGSIQFGPNAARTIEAVMAAKGIDRLDAVMLSHSDIDHFNAIPAMLNRVTVRELLISQACLQAGELGPISVCDVAARKNVAIRILQRGDKVHFDESVGLRVLHPAGIHEQWSDDDNANSLVVEIKYSGRKLLIPGDIEFEGMSEMMQMYSTGDYDVVLSPHHGSLRANTAEFAKWAMPKVVVASEIDEAVIQRLGSVFDSKVKKLSTAGGAVMCTFHSTGGMNVEQFKPVDGY